MPPWKVSIEAMLMILPPRLPPAMWRAAAWRQEEHGLQIGVDHRVPVVLGEVEAVGAADDAGIVDQDVEPGRQARRPRRRRARTSAGRAEVGLDRQ